MPVLIANPLRQVFSRCGPFYCDKDVQFFKCQNVLARTLVQSKGSYRLGTCKYSKTCLKRPLKNGQSEGLKDKW